MQFHSVIVEDSKIFKDTAINGVKYVEKALVKTAEGIYLDEITGAQKDGLYRGTAGILHMYTAIEKILKSGEYTEKIEGITKYLALHATDAVKIAETDGEFVKGMSLGLYSGIAGIGLVLNEVYRAFLLKEAKEGAAKIIDYYINTASESEKGIYWTDNSPVFFDAGIILFLIDSLNIYERKNAYGNEKPGVNEGACGNEKPDAEIKAYGNVKADAFDNACVKAVVHEEKDRLLELIVKGTDYIITNADVKKDGGMRIDHHHVDFKHDEPNFEFGSAGCGYLFTKVYELTGDKKYLDAAIKVTFYLKSIAVKQQKGYLIPYKLGVYDDKFYLGNCHGPVGTGKLFFELYKITKDKSYLNEVVKLLNGAKSLGAPLSLSWGFWNTTCVCCGPAGYIPMLAALYEATSDLEYAKLAHRVGETLVGTQNDGEWMLAFDRTKPEEISAPRGYFNGAAGIATVLMQLYALENKLDTKVGLIDDPYSA